MPVCALGLFVFPVAAMNEPGVAVLGLLLLVLAFAGVFFWSALLLLLVDVARVIRRGGQTLEQVLAERRS